MPNDLSPKKVRGIRKNLQWLMFLRAIILTFFLGATAYIQARYKPPYLFTSIECVYLLIGSTYALTIVYSIMLSKIKRLELLAYIQIVGDVLLVTFLIYLTGGVRSIFSFVYLFCIISAGIILYRRGGIIIASLSGILFAGLLGLGCGFIPFGKKVIEGTSDVSYAFYTLAMNLTAFYLVAFLSSNLSQRLVRVEKELERKKVDFRRLERLYVEIIENVTTGLISLNPDDGIIFLNKAGEDILGLGLGDIYNEPIKKIFPWVDLERKELYRGEAIFKKADGKEIFLGFSITPLKDKRGRIIVFQDITKIKEMEEQVMRSQRLAAIGEMAAGIAHEIRNPIASISGSIEVLKEELEEINQTSPLMTIILREVDRLNKFVSNFLQFSRQTMIKKEKFLLKDLIHDILLSLKNRSDWNQEVEVEMEIPASLSIHGDSGQLRQVFLNLFFNALQAMPNGGSLCISAKNRDESVEIAIQDTGTGMSQDIIDRMFNPFFTTKENGTGLGLAIVHRIVKDHQGEILIKSRQDQGTQVVLTLPIL